MKRYELEQQYKINQFGTIVSPGKFEGEPIYVPYFWELWLDGAYDDFAESWFFTIIDDDDRKQFHELRDIYGIALHETEQGFVHKQLFSTREEYEQFVSTIQAQE